MEKFDFESFKSEALAKLKAGESPLGKEGVLTPLIKAFLEEALEGELESHLSETRDSNRKNGKTKKKVRSSYTYDLNGNILTLQREGLTVGGASPNYGTIDDLTYSYAGNQLMGVSDAITTSLPDIDHFQDGHTGIDYSYDASGNMIQDLNRSLSVIYNHLNKPTYVQKGTNEAIVYIYSADGTKLRQKVLDLTQTGGMQAQARGQVVLLPSGSGSPITKITDYVSGFQYEDADGSGTQASKQLVHLQHARGRCVWEQGQFQYQYNLT
ncbi:MAG: hypothetical protein AAFQ92_27000, partial [Bacteroidota bacterium]